MVIGFLHQCKNVPNPQKQISAQANFIADTIEDSLGTSGIAQVVHNLQDLWMQSSQSSQKTICFICYAGETPWSSNNNISALTHRVSRNWIVRVKQGRGFSQVRGDTLSKSVGNSGLFYDVVEHIRDLIRSMLGISEDNGNDYQGIKPVRLGNDVIDCYDILFSTKNDLCTILTTPEESQ